MPLLCLGCFFLEEVVSKGPDRRPEGGECETIKILKENKVYIPNSTQCTSLLTAKVIQVNSRQAHPRNGQEKLDAKRKHAKSYLLEEGTIESGSDD